MPGFHREREDIAVGRPVQRIAQVEPDALDGADAAEGTLVDQLSAPDDFADQQIAEVLAHRHHEADHLAMEIAVDHCAGRGLRGAIVEGAPIGHHAVLPGVAQWPPFFEQIESARAGAALDAHLPQAEQAQQGLDHLKDLHALVLIDKVQLGSRMQLARDD
ncbi:hypothetical protein FQZ97_943440 [compost metagenome]